MVVLVGLFIVVVVVMIVVVIVVAVGGSIEGCKEFRFEMPSSGSVQSPSGTVPHGRNLVFLKVAGRKGLRHSRSPWENLKLDSFSPLPARKPKPVLPYRLSALPFPSGGHGFV